MKKSEFELLNQFTEDEDYFNVVIKPNETVCKQSDPFEGLRIIIEGECNLACDSDQIRIMYPELMTDCRKQVINYSSLKATLDKLIIPALKDHDMYNSHSQENVPIYRGKYIRTLLQGDKIGDFELGLKLEYNLFTIINSNSTLNLLYIPLSTIQNISKRVYQPFCQMISETILLKCKSYKIDNNMTILFDNIERKMKFMENKKHVEKNVKGPMNDFEATLKLYGRNSSSLIPSYIPHSMNILWQTKLMEDHWKKKIDLRKMILETENERKIHYFRSYHHQMARSNRSLEGMKKKEGHGHSANLEMKVKMPLTPEASPVSNIWTVLKAAYQFKHNPRMSASHKVPKSKSQIIKDQNRLYDDIIISANLENNNNQKDFDFDTETSDNHLKKVELKIKQFLKNLPDAPKTEQISTLKRFVVNNKSIPRPGSTVLVRFKPCNSVEDHSHIQHHILPKDTLSTLQKYRTSK